MYACLCAIRSFLHFAWSAFICFCLDNRWRYGLIVSCGFCRPDPIGCLHLKEYSVKNKLHNYNLLGMLFYLFYFVLLWLCAVLTTWRGSSCPGAMRLWGKVQGLAWDAHCRTEIGVCEIVWPFHGRLPCLHKMGSFPAKHWACSMQVVYPHIRKGNGKNI